MHVHVCCMVPEHAEAGFRMHGDICVRGTPSLIHVRLHACARRTCLHTHAGLVRSLCLHVWCAANRSARTLWPARILLLAVSQLSSEI